MALVAIGIPMVESCIGDRPARLLSRLAPWVQRAARERIGEIDPSELSVSDPLSLKD
jgi:hypothetical protein